MSLSDAVKVDIRRHLGYPAQGLPTSGPMGASSSTVLGYRLDPAYTNLEQRLNGMAPAEESRLTGFAYGAITYSGLAPNAGDQLTATFTGGGLSAPVNVVLTAAAGDTSLTFLQKLVIAINQNASLAAKNFSAVSPWGVGVFSASNVAYPQIEILAPLAFNVSVISTGLIGATVTEIGGLPHPQVVIAEKPVLITVYGYVPILNFLDSALGGSTRNQDLMKAEGFTARHDEMKQRQKLRDIYRRELSAFLGVPVLGRRTGMRRTVV